MRYPGGDAQRAERPDATARTRSGQRRRSWTSPTGKGRVILFAGNPCYRWQNYGEFNMLFNTVLNFNDIKDAPAKTTEESGK